MFSLISKQRRINLRRNYIHVPEIEKNNDLRLTTQDYLSGILGSVSTILIFNKLAFEDEFNKTGQDISTYVKQNVDSVALVSLSSVFVGVPAGIFINKARPYSIYSLFGIKLVYDLWNNQRFQNYLDSKIKK